MLKISQIAHDKEATTLRLEGIINDASYADLEEILSAHRSKGKKTIVLDMAGVTFINGNAAQGLTVLLDDRVRLVNCSPYLRTLFDLIARQNGLSKSSRDRNG
jgi:anti-anti-sigma regulatory factor